MRAVVVFVSFSLGWKNAKYKQGRTIHSLFEPFYCHWDIVDRIAKILKQLFARFHKIYSVSSRIVVLKLLLWYSSCYSGTRVRLSVAKLLLVLHKCNNCHFVFMTFSTSLFLCNSHTLHNSICIIIWTESINSYITM